MKVGYAIGLKSSWPSGRGKAGSMYIERFIHMMRNIKLSKRLYMILFALIICMLTGCQEQETEDYDQLIYADLSELIECEIRDEDFSTTVLEGTVDYQDYVVGILFNPKFEFCQFFFARKVEAGYLLDTISVKLGLQNDYGFNQISDAGNFTMHFAIGEAELSLDDQFLDSIVLTNGKTVDIGVSDFDF